MNITRSTSPLTRDRLTVDLKGLKPRLVARARARGVPVSRLVRLAVEQALGFDDDDVLAVERCSSATCSRTRVSIRLSAADAQRLTDGARAAGLSLGAYVVALMAHAGAVPCLEDRTALAGALTRSNAELSTLSRSLTRLVALLAQGDVSAARPYRQLLDTVDADVRSHLWLASKALKSSTPSVPIASRRSHG